MNHHPNLVSPPTSLLPTSLISTPLILTKPSQSTTTRFKVQPSDFSLYCLISKLVPKLRSLQATNNPRSVSQLPSVIVNDTPWPNHYNLNNELLKLVLQLIEERLDTTHTPLSYRELVMKLSTISPPPTTHPNHVNQEGTKLEYWNQLGDTTFNQSEFLSPRDYLQTILVTCTEPDPFLTLIQDGVGYFKHHPLPPRSPLSIWIRHCQLFWLNLEFHELRFFLDELRTYIDQKPEEEVLHKMEDDTNLSLSGDDLHLLIQTYPNYEASLRNLVCKPNHQPFQRYLRGLMEGDWLTSHRQLRELCRWEGLMNPRVYPYTLLNFGLLYFHYQYYQKSIMFCIEALQTSLKLNLKGGAQLALTWIGYHYQVTADPQVYQPIERMLGKEWYRGLVNYLIGSTTSDANEMVSHSQWFITELFQRGPSTPFHHLPNPNVEPIVWDHPTLSTTLNNVSLLTQPHFESQLHDQLLKVVERLLDVGYLMKAKSLLKLITTVMKSSSMVVGNRVKEDQVVGWKLEFELGLVTHDLESASVALAHLELLPELHLSIVILKSRLWSSQGQPTQGYSLLQSTIEDDDPKLSSYDRIKLYWVELELLMMNGNYLHIRTVIPTLRTLIITHHPEWQCRLDLFKWDSDIMLESHDQLMLERVYGELRHLSLTEVEGRWYWYYRFLINLIRYHQLFNGKFTREKVKGEFQLILEGLTGMMGTTDGYGIGERITDYLYRLDHF